MCCVGKSIIYSGFMYYLFNTVVSEYSKIKCFPSTFFCFISICMFNNADVVLLLTFFTVLDFAYTYFIVQIRIRSNTTKYMYYEIKYSYTCFCVRILIVCMLLNDRKINNRSRFRQFLNVMKCKKMMKNNANSEHDRLCNWSS